MSAIAADAAFACAWADAGRRNPNARRWRAEPLAWACACATVEEIDRLNILQATLLAMRRAVLQLQPQPTLALVDGNRPPLLPCMVRTVVRGDATEPAISAASILAKTERDHSMLELHRRHPEYGFDRHKGYPSADHLARLQTLGPTPAHRRSFAPVRALIEAQQGRLLP